MEEWDKRDKERDRAMRNMPSGRFFTAIFGFGAGFIIGMIYTLIVLGMNI
jgi:hypothetical protein